MKPTFKWLGTACLGVMMACSAHARYVIAGYEGRGLDANKRTHVIVAARGTDMGLQFHMSAAAHARKIQDVNPNDQVLLISVMEKAMTDEEAAQYTMSESDQDDDKKMATGEVYNQLLVHRTIKRHKANTLEELLTRWGFNIYESHEEDLETKPLVNHVERFSQVASMNIYSHSTTFYGLIMDGPFNRIDAHSDMSSLADNFTSDSYAWFHGCNTGQKIIRDMTKQWGIPVAGSYTSTGFQELFFDTTAEGFNFYHDGRAPKTERNGRLSERRLGVNRVSFKKDYSCEKVPCVRMMPDNHAYIGYWGDYRNGGGLGFYRFSCSSAAMPNKDVCYVRMARALINQVGREYTDLSVDLATFKRAVADHLCPRGIRFIKPGYTFEQCAADLERSLTDQSVTVDTFAGKSLSCLPNGDCQSSWKCNESALTKMMGVRYLQKNSCEIINKKDPKAPNRTMVDEYAKYVRGWHVLQSQKK